MQNPKRCHKCGRELVVREGPYGLFWACPNGRPNDKHPTHKIGTSLSVEEFNELDNEMDVVFEIDGYYGAD